MRSADDFLQLYHLASLVERGRATPGQQAAFDALAALFRRTLAVATVHFDDAATAPLHDLLDRFSAIFELWSGQRR